MKKTFSFGILYLLAFGFLSAQSGGTSFDVTIDRLSERVERMAERIETKAETKSEIWEKRAERIAERFEDEWNNDWSVRVDGFGRNMTIAACPEIAFLGIETSEVSVEKAKKLGFENRFGSYVSKVLVKSTAESAGLKAFDYIYGVDEQRTSDNQSLADILEDYEAGDEVTLHFVRKGQKMSAQVKLADNYEFDEDVDENQRPFLGVSPAEDDFSGELDGVSVDVVEKSAAEEMGLKVGDKITSINGFPILDWSDVTTAIQNTKPGESIEVSFEREEKLLSAKGTVKSYEELYPDGNSGNWNLDVDWNETGDIVIDNADDWGEEQNENRAFIGIYTEEISKEKARKLGFENPYGTYVSGIIPNSGAEKAGLKPFDYIYGFDEYRAGEQQRLGVVMKKYEPGNKATVHFIRKGKKSTTQITFTRPMSSSKTEQNSCQDAFFGILQQNNGQEDGVAISPVKGSTAAELGLKDGDVLTHINGYQIVDWMDVTTAIGMLKPGETIAVDFTRGGKEMKASKSIKSLAETKNCANCDCGENESVVIATTPNKGNWTVWSNDNKTAETSSPTPRMSIENAKIELTGISAGESSSLMQKGIKLPESNTLAVETLRLVPNSKTGLFNLDFSLTSNGNTSVRIYNLTGRVLYEYDLGSFTGKFSDSVDISQNGAGNYYLEISQGGKIFTKKIVLSRN